MSVFAIEAFADDEPGKRPDVTPWFGYGSVIKKILADEEDVAKAHRDLIEELLEQKTSYARERKELEQSEREAGISGWPLLTDSSSDYRDAISDLDREYYQSTTNTREAYRKKFNRMKTDMENALASPPNEKIRKKCNLLKRIPQRAKQWRYTTLVSI